MKIKLSILVVFIMLLLMGCTANGENNVEELVSNDKEVIELSGYDYEGYELQSLSEEARGKDIDFISKQVYRNFTGDSEKLNQVRSGLEELKTEEDAYVYNEGIIKLLASLHDSFTYMDHKGSSDYLLPVNFEIIGGEIYILNSYLEDKSMVGSKVLSINGVDVKEVFEYMVDHAHGDNMNGQRAKALEMMTKPNYFSLFFKERVATVEIETEDYIYMTGYFSEKILLKELSFENCKQDNSGALVNYIPAYKTQYGYKTPDNELVIEYYTTLNLDNDTLFGFSNAVNEHMKTYPESTIIIDFRNYYEGDELSMRHIFSNEFIEAHADRIYVFTSKYSSTGACLLTDALQKFDVQVIGEVPGGSKYTMDGGQTYDLPSGSGFTVVSKGRRDFTFVEKNREMEVDYLIEPGYDYYFGEYDPWVEQYMELISKSDV